MEDFAKATIILTYTSEDEEAAYRNGVIRVSCAYFYYKIIIQK